jgi:hypothetical protein
LQPVTVRNNKLKFLETTFMGIFFTFSWNHTLSKVY